MRFSYRNGSKAGLLLGAAVAVAGGLTVTFAPSHTVYHGPVFRVPSASSVHKPEKVTPSRAQFYGGCGIVGGVLFSLFSLYVPRPRASGSSTEPN